MKIDFTIEHLQIIDKAIQQIPYYLAAPLIEHINKELQIEKAIMDTPISPSEAQKLFDAQVDAHDMPTGQTTPKNEFSGD